MNSLVLLGVLFTAVSAVKISSDNRASLFKVTDLFQLWRYQVGAGYVELGGDKITICIVGPKNNKFVRNIASKWAVADGDECLEVNMYEVAHVSDDVFTIKSVKQNQYWCCLNNEELLGISKVSSWGKFKLFVDENGDHLTIRNAHWMDWYVYQRSDSYLYCSRKSHYYFGNTGFLGWVHWMDGKPE